ncbi:FAD-dependent oxidoreductase [Thorsellia anophelis]|uniref:2-octaprenylphenol hydroxylase n=1 Tax=Thorsellia anophelis DSM 18579 TaxID=1123402 RepID=A0A1I0A5Q0_9GAMM|nr:FAD-dependent oxidoreductase [Thorsellia anophelis]SES89470.1 2-octaprenylphenol hydroxylase [Thorsellia anophelis DSM 18579]
MQNYDVVIVGGGMVGLTLALSLSQNQFKVAVIEKHSAPTASELPTLRVSAFNLASETLFKQLGVWQTILGGTTCPYHSMSVWEKDTYGHIEFNARENGVDHIGVIAENHRVQYALWQAAKSNPSIKLFEQSEINQVAFGENEVFISLNTGMLTGKLLVAADGAHSILRQYADVPITFWDYKHHALMARIRTHDEHNETARQVFSPNSVLAFLPQMDPYTSTIVWSGLPDDISKLQSCDEAYFNELLSTSFDMKLGLCEVLSERKTFPLTARYAHHFAKERLVLIGDAAHTIHPLAGQGVNLGLMDVALLSEELTRLNKSGKDFGRHYYLGNYERQRKQQAVKMLALMQGFQDLFAGNNLVKKSMRTLGVGLVNKLPFVKNHMMTHALGLYDMPEKLKAYQFNN